ncbi:MAG: hypothetical protein FJW20_23835 [Acidimicrobiia bacterium]|nr:hypothetical protein [Acidimicrobiia bacterium]
MIRCVAFLLCAGLTALGQTTRGRIVGVVSDTSGGIVASASVVARNAGTSARLTALTSASGTFAFADLPIGRYEISVEVTGFKKYIHGPFDVLVDQTVRIDVRLEVGVLSEQVTVKEGAPLIQTDQSGISQVVENQTVVQLPLNGRNFVRLGSLVPGTTRGSPGDGTRRTRQQGELLTANGARAEHNSFLLDGAENNSAIEGVAVVIPSVDAVQEFKVQTSNYSAEFGRAGGAIVNIAIKSGSNEFHGTAYEFLRNDKLDARDYFDPGKTPLRRNQFGFSLGGPVIRNRAFLFGNAEWVRERRTNNRGFLVPESAWRSGDFAGQPTLFDPLDADAAGTRRAFPANRIPASRVSGISQKVIPYWPTPNNPGDRARNYLENFNDPVNQYQFHLRGDVQVTAKDQVMVRLSRTVSEDLNKTIGYNSEWNNLKPKAGVASWTRALSASMINEARFSAYLFNFENLPEGLGRDFPTEFGLPRIAVSPAVLRFPSINLRNVQNLGGAATQPLFRKEINYQWIDAFTWIRGGQTIKIGGEFRIYQMNNFQPQTAMGQYIFNGPFTGQRGTQYINGFPDFLLGFPNQQLVLDPTYYDANRLRNKRLNLYVQDDINLSQRLTLNLGLRWERDGNWTNATGQWAYFDYAKAELVYPDNLKFPFSLPYSHRFEPIRSMKRPTNHALAPRAGFAWRPFGNNNTVVRSGFGISWAQPLLFILNNSSQNPPPFFLRTDMVSSNLAPELRFGVFPAPDTRVLVPRNPSFSTHQPSSLTNGYVQQWNFGIERVLPGQVAGKVSYVGSRGIHLERRYEGNPALPPGPGNINARRKYPEFRQIVQQESSASSSYHSLQLSGERRLSRGVQFLAGYTWSKSIDDASSWNPNSDSSPFAQDPRNLRLERGRSAFDLRHRFTLSYVWEVPGKTRSRIANLAVAGWQLSGILSLQTGFATTPTVGGDIPNAGTRTTRPNLNGPGNLPPSQRTIERWFNTAAFSAPAPFTFGTGGRTIIDTPGTRVVDFSAMKVFRVHEGHQIQFRAEFFNGTNHPNFGSPNINIDNPGFGAVRSGGGGREGQLAIKYIF